jgi:hypothetical protein
MELLVLPTEVVVVVDVGLVVVDFLALAVRALLSSS